MQITDYLKYSFSLYKNNKLRTYLCIIITFIIFFVADIGLFVCFNYQYNASNIEVFYLENNPVYISCSNEKNQDKFIKLAEKSNPDYIYTESLGLTLFDFDVCTIELSSGHLPKRKDEIILPVTEDVLNMYTISIQGTVYNVTGYYNSNYFNNPIADLNTNYDIVYGKTITTYYLGGNVKANIEYIDELIECDINNTYSNTYNQYRSFAKSSNIVTLSTITVSIVMLMALVGFLVNSITMCFDQNKRLFSILHILGLDNKRKYYIMLIYSFFILIIGMILSTASIFIFSLSINLNALYNSIIPNFFKAYLTDGFTYSRYCPWWLSIIPFSIYLVVFVVYFLFYVKRDNNVISVIKE